MAFNHGVLVGIIWEVKLVRLQRLPEKSGEERLRTLFLAACRTFNFHLDVGWSESTNQDGDYLNLQSLSSAGFAGEVRDPFFPGRCSCYP